MEFNRTAHREMGSYWRSTRALLSCSLRVDICNCCFVLLGEINDDDDDDGVDQQSSVFSISVMTTVVIIVERHSGDC